MSVHVTNVKIKSEWTDYNKHLNMAYYVLVFDQAWEILLEKFGMGETSAKSSGMSTMVVETNTTYDNEIFESGEITTGFLFNTEKHEFYDRTITYNGGLEFVYDLTPEVKFHYYDVGSSDVNLVAIDSYSKANIRGNF